MSDYSIFELHSALVALRPGVEWTMTGTSIDGVVYPTGVEPLTEQEVQSYVDAERASVKAARDAAIAHAKSLGFTDAMIAVMYPSLGATDA